jgi:hypothetical protein
MRDDQRLYIVSRVADGSRPYYSVLKIDRTGPEIIDDCVRYTPRELNGLLMTLRAAHSGTDEFQHVVSDVAALIGVAQFTSQQRHLVAVTKCSLAATVAQHQLLRIDDVILIPLENLTYGSKSTLVRSPKMYILISRTSCAQNCLKHS